MKKFYCNVAIDIHLKNESYSYEHTDIDLVVGDIVEVSFGRRTLMGCVLQCDLEEIPTTSFEIKKIKSVVNGYRLSVSELKIYTWMSRYYHYPLGKVIFDCLPKILKRPQKITLAKQSAQEIPYQLNPDQEQVFLGLKSALFTGFSQSLLHGVTGSGKTFIYLKLILEVLAQKKSILFLVPEINLTPQFLAEFIKYVPCPVLAYHSSISNSEKYAIWKRASDPDAEPFLLVGVRSASFVPFVDLGLIILDEEHDGSFKQDDRCPYHARDVLTMIAKEKNIPILFGSATPAVETYYRFTQKMKENYYVLSKRAVSGSFLPTIKILDMQNETEDSPLWPITPAIIDSINHEVSIGNQVLVFINRLGYSHYMQCLSCRHQFFCPNCSVGLKYYKKKNELHCQICSYSQQAPAICPSCGSLKFTHRGFGTEKVMESLRLANPKLRLSKFDRDEITTLTKLEETLQNFHDGKIDVLVGTQMLVKGHNFKRVNLVVVLGIDSQFNFPDFRANEHAFQTLMQISGRAGRYSEKSMVLVPTLNPQNEIFKLVQNNHYKKFYQDELDFRSMMNDPPNSFLVQFLFISKNQNTLMEEIHREADRLKDFLKSDAHKIELLGPIPTAIEKRVNKYSWYFLLKAKEREILYRTINSFKMNVKLSKTVEYRIIVDPLKFG